MLAQLRDVLAAEDSAIVAEKNDYRRTVCPELPELHESIRNFGKKNRRQARAERIAHALIVRIARDFVNVWPDE